MKRRAAALAYIRANRLNRITVSTEQNTIGILAVGKPYADTLQAQLDLGLDEPALRRAGLRIAKIGALCPLDAEFVREFAQGLRTLIVVEEKRDFLERQVGRALCETGPIRILGKHDHEGKALFPQEGGMHGDMIAELLGRVLARELAAADQIEGRLGDGALMHSSYMNIRFAVSADVNITFKILFNGVIANTGGQESLGSPSVHELIQHLSLEGVKKIVLVTKSPKRYAGYRFAAKVMLRPVKTLESSMIELAETAGVTVLIYDGECANERRRRQKRGKAPAALKFTVVNEDVCENCGDCGQAANCMSLQKIDTEFGAKTQIHQSSCNQDQACLQGECPSFVTVEVSADTTLRKPEPQTIDVSQLPEPALAEVSQPYSIYMPGLGGTGVLTLNAILAQAATLDGHEVKSYDLAWQNERGAGNATRAFADMSSQT